MQTWDRSEPAEDRSKAVGALEDLTFLVHEASSSDPKLRRDGKASSLYVLCTVTRM